MALPSYSSDEDFLGSLGISLDEVDLMADADIHASMTGIFAQYACQGGTKILPLVRNRGVTLRLFLPFMIPVLNWMWVRVLWLEFRSKYSIKTARLARLSVHLTWAI
ncbi:hypothetical protein JCGZ_08851 [Jatropha curcas]|uniref:Uncharacterized protein n=1 Tax=Jatropha curcas TaxID=180498 RepID=A0A067JC09_JATCU|nr:hypothetical protein JCGZ_08851 [Jatropha curcas]